MATNIRFGFPIAYVKDMQQSKRFYVESPGLKVEREAPNFVQFEHFALASDAPLGDLDTELYWLVDDAEAAYREMQQKKAPIAKPIEEKPFGKVFGVRDPDGKTRYVVQLAQHRPSKAVSG